MVDELELRRRLRGLAVDQPPEDDLWPGIESRLAPRSRRRQRRLWSLAAAVMLSLGLLWSLQTIAPERNVDLPRAHMVGPEDAADTLLTAWSQVLTIEREQAQVRPGDYDVAGIDERMAAVRELDASLAQLASALLLEPESQLLRRLMHQTLQQRIALSRAPLTA